jgi:hypothetical protein
MTGKCGCCGWAKQSVFVPSMMWAAREPFLSLFFWKGFGVLANNFLLESLYLFFFNIINNAAFFFLFLFCYFF